SRQLLVTDVPTTTPGTTSAWATAPTRVSPRRLKSGNCQLAPRVSHSPQGRAPNAPSQVRSPVSSPMSLSARPRARYRVGLLERPRSHVLGPGVGPTLGVQTWKRA